MRYSIEPRERRYVKRYGFLSFARNLDTHPTKAAKKLLIQYRPTYGKTSGGLWQNCKDIPAVNNNNDTSSFSFKVKITGQTENDGTKDVDIMVPLSFLSVFWRNLELLLTVRLIIC